MPQLQSSFQGNQSVTQTDGGGVPGYVIPQVQLPQQDFSAIDALLAQRARRQLGAMSPNGATGLGGGARSFAPPAATFSRPDRVDPLDLQLEQATKRDAILQMQARQNPAPMRMVTGPGVIPGYVQDVNAMNAYQRQAYLPQNAGASYSPGVVARSVAQGEDDQAFGNQIAADRARARNAEWQANAMSGR